ncbi:GPR endopeptidase [Clostridium botulinum]|uniref:Germination protease n=2 Tax=Clostridium botulinum TaxID=1491 RepID=A0A846I1E6_CLOBO|nr:GPR endopeptidase [Clostridium botulinum]AJD28001.1 GPR endopeptidase [Clostridium botulinum CDC_297]EPS51301.1 germination protease [Clostridium botulinum A1 str. CFSAN002368]ACQ54704.1 GPR endopeptidase [Clostridium botulinum Ba4 str. 657]AJE12710.1 GPR endopeptidase [Clostridium botulinum CDC_1436]APQ99671.1 GPR endopeptidase [Clostridium botulinum]
MFNIRTDLAIEAKEIYEQKNKSKIDGVQVFEYKEEDVDITEVKIINNNGELAMKKPKGSYITLNVPEFAHYDSETLERVSEILGKVLKKIIKVDKSMTALVVGLGNWNVTADALGPKVVSRIMVTRHLKELVPDQIDENVRPVCAISPGVLGITGLETSEVIKGIVQKIKPNLVICIDALASRKTDRVNNTIQIGTTGISPGAGVGNKRAELSEKTLGVPVIAVGVPTVVDAATLANDTIDMVLEDMIKNSEKGGKFYEMLKSVDTEDKLNMIKEVLDPRLGNLIVTPKEEDMLIESLSKIIGNGINMALQPAFQLEEINKYLN